MLEHSTYVAVLILGVLSGLTTIIGVLLAIYIGNKVKWIAAGIGFSVGIMLLIALLELIPEALAATSSSKVIFATLLGVGLIGALDYVLPHTHLVKEKGLLHAQFLRAAHLVVIGLILHDFPEGFAMANAYIAAPATGVAVALAIALHNIPEEFAMAVPAVASQQRAFLWRAALISALAEPVGAALGLFAASIEQSMVPFFMAFAAGAMIYISLHELVPMARHFGKLHLFGTGILGSVLVYMLIVLLFPG
jgi:ZIP family zinc transporter